MIEKLKILQEFQKKPNMSQLAISLRTTQSTISKKIASLENELKIKLLERKGRKSVLTPQAVALIEQLLPLLDQLEEKIWEVKHLPMEKRSLRIGVSESLMPTVGPLLLKDFPKNFPHLIPEFHTHRTPLILDKVRSGQYDLGIGAGQAESHPQIEFRKLYDEQYYLAGKNLPKVLPDRPIDVFSIEPGAASAQWIQWKLKPRSAQLFKIVGTLESYLVLGHMAKEGAIIALLPESIIQALPMPKELAPGIHRPISLFYKKHLTKNPQTTNLIEHIIELFHV